MIYRCFKIHEQIQIFNGINRLWCERGAIYCMMEFKTNTANEQSQSFVRPLCMSWKQDNEILFNRCSTSRFPLNMDRKFLSTMMALVLFAANSIRHIRYVIVCGCMYRQRVLFSIPVAVSIPHWICRSPLPFINNINIQKTRKSLKRVEKKVSRRLRNPLCDLQSLNQIKLSVSTYQ